MKVVAYPVYENYQESGVEWIGKVPSHWQVRKGKWLFKKASRAVRPKDSIVTCFRDGVVTLRSNRRTDGFTTALKEHGYQGIRQGDLVIHAMDAFAGAIGVSDSDGKSSPVYSACIPRFDNSVDPYFYAYYLRQIALSGLLIALAKGIRERSTDFRFNDFGNLLLAVPPLSEQRAIANFLDEKCARLDEAVRIRERQIELLRERRQILIQQAVTRGLNPDAPMKGSGVDWIGQIPAHWELRRFKFLCSICTGARNTEDRVDNATYPFFVRSQSVERIDTYSFDGEAILTAGDGAGVGKVFHYINGKFDFHQRVYKFSDFKEVLGKYLFLYLRNNFANVALLGTAKSTVDSLRLPLIQDFEVVFPLDIQEQQKIIETAYSEDEKIADVISTKQSQITALQEYKTVLINAAVTGRIRVGGEQLAASGRL